MLGPSNSTPPDGFFRGVCFELGYMLHAGDIVFHKCSADPPNIASEATTLNHNSHLPLILLLALLSRFPLLAILGASTATVRGFASSVCPKPHACA